MHGPLAAPEEPSVRDRTDRGPCDWQPERSACLISFPRDREKSMNTPPIVAVASDSGDFDAVCELLSALPAACPAAFIVVQHLDAAREKLPAATIAKRTNLPVVRAQDGMLPEAGHVYVSVAHDILSVSGGRIRVTCCLPRSPSNSARTRSVSFSQAQVPTAPSGYGRLGSAAPSHWRNTRGLPAFPACPSAPLKPVAWQWCCAPLRSQPS